MSKKLLAELATCNTADGMKLKFDVPSIDQLTRKALTYMTTLNERYEVYDGLATTTMAICLRLG